MSDAKSRAIETPKVLDRIVEKLPFHKLTGPQVANIIGDLLGVVMFIVFMFSKPNSCLAFFCVIIWFAFVVWCYCRTSRKPAT
jgi:hypothetical protein